MGMCGGGTVSFLFQPGSQQFNVGSAAHPVGIYPCGVVAVYPSGYVEYQGGGGYSTLEAGIFINVSYNFEGPWIGPPKFRFRPWVDFHVGLGGVANLQLEPDFRINSLAIVLNAHLKIGGDYELLVKSGTFTLFSASIHGNVTLRFHPAPTNISGSVTGSVTVPVIGTKSFTIGFNKNIAYEERRLPDRNEHRPYLNQRTLTA